MVRPVEVTAAAPATIGNVGPGFDVLGLAVAGLSDRVTARVAPHGDVRVADITGDDGQLPRDAESNTASIAAAGVRRLAGRTDIGIDLVIEKGIPLESGLGSSAASAAAAAYAVNQLLGAPLRKVDLLGPCVDAEAVVAARHGDNVAPALLGGLVLVHLTERRPRVQRLPVPHDLIVVVVHPNLRISTKDARGALPTHVPLAARSRNAVDLALMICACYSGELGILAECVRDDIVTPARIGLIRGGADVLAAADRAGALAASISGAGPTLFAFCHSQVVAEQVRAAMVNAFAAHDVDARGIISPADCPGVRIEHVGGGGA